MCISSTYSSKNMHRKISFLKNCAKTCNSKLFGPYSKTYTFKVCAAWGRAAQDLTLLLNDWKDPGILASRGSTVADHYPQESKSIHSCEIVKQDLLLIGFFFESFMKWGPKGGNLNSCGNCSSKVLPLLLWWSFTDRHFLVRFDI